MTSTTFTYNALIAGALALACTVPSAAQSSGTSGTRAQTQSDRPRDNRNNTASSSDTGSLRGADRTFLQKAMAGNAAEVALAQVAARKASSPAVKELAQTLEKHHADANAKLKSMASADGASAQPPDLAPEHKQLQDRLSRLDGKAFDDAYASAMVKEHEKDIKAYETASRSLQHAGLKAYATETLPTLKQHLEKARSAQGSQARSTSRDE